MAPTNNTNTGDQDTWCFVFISETLFLFFLVPSTEVVCTKEACTNRNAVFPRAFIRKFCDLREVPKDIPSEYRIIILQGNSISSLPNGVFRYLTKVKSMALGQNGITDINTESFTGLKSLVMLGLQSNYISSLPDGVFRHLMQCRVLHLERNRISSITTGSFTGLKSLEKLYLGFNLVSSLSHGVFSHLIHCKKLYLGRNRISSMSTHSFIGLRSLEELYLQTNMLTYLPIGVFSHLSSCKILNVDVNRITTITVGSFAGLLNLLELYLGYNRITSLPHGVFDDLVSIKLIELPGNQLTYLNPVIFSKRPQFPLILWLSYPHSKVRNQWNCSLLCWLKQEEKHGTIRWNEKNGYSGHVICFSGGSWDSLQCAEQGRWGLLCDYF